MKVGQDFLLRVYYYAPDCALNLWVLASLTKWIMNIRYKHIHWAGSAGPLSNC